MRTINVSERLYGIVKFGSQVYDESLGSFLERFVDALSFRQEGKELITRLELGISQNTCPSQTENSGMVKEGLSLLAEFDSAKAKELEEKLKEIKSQNTFPEEEKKAVN